MLARGGHYWAVSTFRLLTGIAGSCLLVAGAAETLLARGRHCWFASALSGNCWVLLGRGGTAGSFRLVACTGGSLGLLAGTPGIL